jgi:cell wall assembly regulator SMI1
MSEVVARLDVWLSRHRASYYAELRPGLTAEKLAAFEAQLGVPLPDSLRALYQWRDGHSSGRTRSFHGNRTWMTSAEIVSTKQLMDSMIGADFEPGWWERSWIPFLHNGGGSYLCVDAVGVPAGTPGQLVEFWNRDRDRPVVSPSLEHWLHSFVASLEHETWAETRHGFECVARSEDGLRP